MATAAADEGVRYRDKVTIVTGGANGIGRACVELFAKHGSKVVIVDIAEEAGKELESSLNRAGSDERALFVRCDISNQDDVEKAIQETIAKFGRIDCVINNGAYFLPKLNLEELSLEQFHRIIDVNLLGAFLVSKAGLIGMTKNLAIEETSKGVRINCVSPAGTNTNMFQRGYDSTINPAKFKEFAEKHSQYMGRLIEPVEVAKTCLYLATDATYSTGQNVYVSGGTELDYGFKSQMDFFFQP